MRRREFITGLAGAAMWPSMAPAQQAAMPVIGVLLTQSADDYKIEIAAFLQSLKEAGYVEGQNVAVEYRWAENQADRLPALAADLVRRRVAVIVALNTTAALAAKAATTTIPIVFGGGGDPVALGLVASLNRPGANLTGFVNFTAELAPKRLQLLRELIPDAALFGVLAESAFPDTQSVIADLQAAARTLGLQLIVVDARTDSDLETAFTTFSRQRVGAVLVSASPFFNRRTEQLAALAARHALPRDVPIPRVRPGRLLVHRSSIILLTARHNLPAVFDNTVYDSSLKDGRHNLPAIFDNGGLLSYGPDRADIFRRSASYVSRILRGARPADLPVQVPTKFEMVLNGKTAKALDLTVPQSILLRADEIIE